MKQTNLSQSHTQKKPVELRIHQPTPHFINFINFILLGETIHL